MYNIIIGYTYCHTEWRKSDIKGQISWDHLYVLSKNNSENELIYKTEIESQM